MHSEEYDSSFPGWVPTTFFLDHQRGATDEDYEAIPTDAAEVLIEQKLRRKADRARDR